MTIPAEGGASSIVSGVALALGNAGVAARFAVVGRPAIDRYTFELRAPVAGVYDLGIVVPGAAPGRLQQLTFGGVALDAGGVERVTIDLTSPGSPALSVDRNGDGSAERSLSPATVDIADAPPQLLGVRQLESSTRDDAGRLDDPASYGLLVGALFDKPVTRESAEQKTNYQVDANAVIGAQLQHSGRLAYLYLQKPIGALTPRSLTVTGIVDDRNQSLGTTTQPIVMTLADGAHVFGQVRDAGGAGIGGGILTLAVNGDGGSFDVAAIRTDAQGGFDFDFVPRLGDSFTLTAQHPVTRDLASLTARIHGAGEQLLLNPTFLGRGTVRGRVLAPGGTSTVPDIPIALIPGSVLGSRGFQARTNALGEFTFTDVPVGVFTLSAADGRGNFGQVTGVIAHGGDTRDAESPARRTAGRRRAARRARVSCRRRDAGRRFHRVRRPLRPRSLEHCGRRPDADRRDRHLRVRAHAAARRIRRRGDRPGEPAARRYWSVGERADHELGLDRPRIGRRR